jgi:valyl-tRNA synthetase
MKEISKRYDQEIEKDIYNLWEDSGLFNPDNLKNTKGRYSNVLPPPNANGELHLGHASGYAVMDIFGRYHRMKGEKTLLLPGKDHAGILTQVVYERKLKEEKNMTRYDLGRGKFYAEAYDFCMDRANYMRAQEKIIGISADWSREKFTLDPEVLEVALETFSEMYRDGMIYRGERIINWCPRCATALSDLEVLHKETDGKLYYIRYLIKDSQEFITVATTRPETMLGDTAVAVNPKDNRYKKFVGKTAILPLMLREIPIISDRKIEMEFGTGAVKITPAHDPLDWKISQEHKLEVIQVINEKAEITEKGGKYAGQNVKIARENIIKDLENQELLEKVEDTKINISVCERCKCVIEPLISKQWFVNVDAEKYSIKKECLKAIKADKIKFYPGNFKKIMIQWFENMEDWCISRQIWWGPRIPVWYKNNNQEEVYVGIEPPKGENWVQDEDTFDTWFTSGQWAYATLGFPKGKDYEEFYPTDMMIMGRDILFFWAARMILMSLYRTKNVPFENLYFTGLIRDKDGRKMSKSLGNGIDPIEMIDKYGADAVRLSLVMGTTPGQDSRLYEEKIESYRNFVTKLWNIYRYCVSDPDFELAENISKQDMKSLADRYIVSELEEATMTINSFMKHKEISLAQERLRRFTWDQLADWYIEIHKIEKNNIVLGYVLDKILKLWHPFTPFVTEEMYQEIFDGKKILMVEKWPEEDKNLIDKKAIDEFEALQEIITKIRNIRTNYHIAPTQIIEAYSAISDDNEILEKLARVKIIPDKKSKTIKVTSKNISLGLDIAGIIDVKKEIANLEKEIKNLENSISKTEMLLKNDNFLKKADADVINETNVRVKEYKETLQVQRDLLKDLQQL